ncbi:nyctalopin-like [Daphnia carinata]|uniref:nyctalopin-like n=1 Tax=Daphnia carinata TaxID=120202 RepID=UPI00257A7C56|nr:nyctalopin-like [Daphnia carinata]XP_057376105.1 nyctalopin-like [Daphnia carinata]
MQLTYHSLQIIAAGILLVVAKPSAASNDVQRGACPEDYSPCSCNLSSNGLEIVCADVSIGDIQDVFYRTQSLFLYSVSLTATSSSGTVILPADVLKDKRAQHIYLGCPSISPKLSLVINAASFEFTRFNTSIFEIHDCDLSTQADMNFLKGFVVLHTLRIVNTWNVEAIENLPTTTLPGIKELTISSCTGLGNVPFPDLTPARLEWLYLDGNNLNDVQVNNILISIGSSSSSSSMEHLSIANNALNKVPRIAAFSQLVTYDVSYNDIPYMSLSTLIFSSPVRFLGLKSVSMTAIEGGAFQGNYTYAQVNLEDNQLTAFREDVFKSMLQQMTVQPPAVGGQLIVTGNPFDCDCGLAWLIRDNQPLVPSVKNGVCGGFFRFEDLNPDAYANC